MSSDHRKKSSRRKDLTNNKYGRLFVVSLNDRSDKKRSYWNCLCECGNKTVVQSGQLKSGHTKSCGCYHKELLADYGKTWRATHRKSLTKEYKAWSAAKQRCFNEKTKNYHRYGGRGITMCDRWKDSFENFYADMGRAGQDLSLDRIDNNENYTPENCRWTTMKIQQNNRVKNLVFGEKHHQAKMSDLEVMLARIEKFFYNTSNKILACKYKMSQSAMGKILAGQTRPVIVRSS